MVKKSTSTRKRRGDSKSKIRVIRKEGASKTSGKKNEFSKRKVVYDQGALDSLKNGKLRMVTGPNKQEKRFVSKSDNLRIIPLGGVEEIGKNMTVIEYKNDIIIVDMGFQFAENSMPGVDFVVPDTKYLEKRKKNIRGIFITHGHLDHTGGIPYIISKIGNPPIYTREFGALMIKKRQEEFKHLPTVEVHSVKNDQTIKAGSIKVKFFSSTHSIPDSAALIIETPVGKILFMEDVRVEHKDGNPIKEEVDRYKKLKDEKFLLFTLDSSNVDIAGFANPESKTIETINNIVRDARGRVLIGTFASQVERILNIFKIAQKYKRKVVVDGRSMKTNAEIMKELKLLDPKSKIFAPLEEISDYPDNKILILATGAQGEEYSALDRISNKTHKHITLKETDTIILSASIIPGNESSVAKLKDNLYRQKPKIVTYLDTEVHTSGHGNRGELEWIHKQINYQFFMPVHGHHYMLRVHADLAKSLGVPEKNILIPDNGSIIEISKDGKNARILKESANSGVILVDSLGTGDVKDVVIRDRQMLSSDGIFVIVTAVDVATGKIKKSPDIISRGFVYLRESQELLKEARRLTQKTIEETTEGMHPINFDYVKNLTRDKVAKLLYQKTKKRPVVLLVLIEI